MKVNTELSIKSVSILLCEMQLIVVMSYGKMIKKNNTNRNNRKKNTYRKTME